MSASPRVLTVRFSLVLLVLIGVFASAGAGRAEAFTNYYCSGWAAPPFTFCTDGTFHNYDDNYVAYRGGGSIDVCEKMLRRDGSARVFTCGTNSSLGAVGGGNCCLDLQALINQQSNIPHTISGRARAV